MTPDQVRGHVGRTIGDVHDGACPACPQCGATYGLADAPVRLSALVAAADVQPNPDHGWRFDIPVDCAACGKPASVELDPRTGRVEAVALRTPKDRAYLAARADAPAAAATTPEGLR